MNNMNEMNRKTRVKLSICGTDYILRSGENIDYVKSIGEEVDRLMYELMSNDHRISTTMAAVLTAITCADERRKATDSSDNLRSQLKDYLNDNAALRAELDSLKAENDKLKSELERFRQR